MRINSIPVLCMLLLAGSCLEPYFPDPGKYVDLPVIVGTLTNEPGPYFIRLTHSTAILDMETKPIRRAVVIISDDQGNEETLTEIQPGIYRTDPNGIRGITGRSYRLTVSAEGKTYQSEYELLQEPVGIENIYAVLEREPVNTGYIDGLQFYLTTGNFPHNEINFLWSLRETYRFHSELELDYIYYALDSIVENHSDSALVCWRTEQSDQTFSWSSANPLDNQLKNYPLHFVDGLTPKLSDRYSVEVSQFTISQAAYNYWSEIQKLHQESGSLYSRQPYQVKGNIKNTESPGELVLGYFLSAGVSKKRIYIDRPTISFNYDECLPVINLPEITNPFDLKFPLYAMQVTSTDRAFANLSCFDCRLKGGSVTPPDFWEE